MKRCASGCRRKIEAGHAVSTGPSIVFLIACRLAGPGTIAKSLGRAMIVGIVRDRACRGTSSIVANAPSFTCCARHTSSSSTTFTRCGSSKLQKGINKSQVTIFADAEHRKIGRGCPEQITVTFTLNRTIRRIAAQAVKFAQRHSADKTVYEKTPEGLWGAIVHTEILIEMEANNSRPINSWSFDECR